MESEGGVAFVDPKMKALSSLDGEIGWLAAFPYGLQHVLAMFVANLAPIAIIAAAAGLPEDLRATLIQNAMFIAGIGTFVQLFPVWRVGSGLPIVMGISFTFVSVACTIAATQGYGALVGAVIVGGLIEGVLGLFARWWRRIITPIVAAVVVTSIGFSLLGVGAASFGGGSGAEDFGSATNLILGTVSLLACLAFQGLAKGATKQLSVLFGLIVGYLVAIPLGKVDFSGFASAQLFSLPGVLPVTPEFNFGRHHHRHAHLPRVRHRNGGRLLGAHGRRAAPQPHGQGALRRRDVPTVSSARSPACSAARRSPPSRRTWASSP